MEDYLKDDRPFAVCLVVGIFKRLAGIFLEENRHMHKYIRAPRILKEGAC